jgi:hypothetical protein
MNTTTPIPPTPNNATALAALRGCKAQLRAGHIDSLGIAAHLTGARATRAVELCELIADAIAFCERLTFVCTTDVRYAELRDR